jgi:hypothetical protein
MAKLAWKKALLGKIETVYGTDSVPVGATDAIQVMNNLKVTPIELEYEELDVALPYLGHQIEVPTVEFKLIEFTCRLAASGVAGTPPPLGPLLRGCGFTETISAGVDVQYDLNSSIADALTFKYNEDGELHTLLGARGDCDFVYTAKKMPLANFRFVGLFSPVTDAVMPAVTLTAWKKPLPVTNANTTPFTVHGFAGKLHELTVKLNNQFARRNLPGVYEVLVTDRKPDGTLRIDNPSVAAFDYMAKVRNADVDLVTITHGTVAGAKVKLDQPKCQLKSPEKGETDRVQTVQYSTRATPNAGNDEVKLTFS